MTDDEAKRLAEIRAFNEAPFVVDTEPEQRMGTMIDFLLDLITARDAQIAELEAATRGTTISCVCGWEERGRKLEEALHRVAACGHEHCEEDGPGCRVIAEEALKP